MPERKSHLITLRFLKEEVKMDSLTIFRYGSTSVPNMVIVVKHGTVLGSQINVSLVIRLVAHDCYLLPLLA